MEEEKEANGVGRGNERKRMVQRKAVGSRPRADGVTARDTQKKATQSC